MSFIIPQWPVPKNVFSYITTRQGGVSQGAYASFNLAQHVEDDPNLVTENRRQLEQNLHLALAESWLTQVHGIEVVTLPKAGPHTADAAITSQANTACVVLTADCLPVLLCNQEGSEVAAVHAGWKGLASGVLEATLAQMTSAPDTLFAYLGPAISAPHFEVGREVLTAFTKEHHEHQQAFKPAATPEVYYADLYLLARQKLSAQGVCNIYGGTYCTYQQEALFYSYRRDHGITGRIASLIYFT